MQKYGNGHTHNWKNRIFQFWLWLDRLNCLLGKFAMSLPSTDSLFSVCSLPSSMSTVDFSSGSSDWVSGCSSSSLRTSTDSVEATGVSSVFSSGKEI